MKSLQIFCTSCYREVNIFLCDFDTESSNQIETVNKNNYLFSARNVYMHCSQVWHELSTYWKLCSVSNGFFINVHWSNPIINLIFQTAFTWSHSKSLNLIKFKSHFFIARSLAAAYKIRNDEYDNKPSQHTPHDSWHNCVYGLSRISTRTWKTDIS